MLYLRLLLDPGENGNHAEPTFISMEIELESTNGTGRERRKKKKHSNLFYHSCFLFLLDWHCQAGVSVRRRQSNIVKAFKKMEPAISKEKASHGRQKVLLMQR